MALQNDFIVKNGMVVRNTATLSTIDAFVTTSTNVINLTPSLDFIFTRGVLDSRISFSRPSAATYVGSDGFIKYANLNEPRFEYSTTSTGTCLGLLIEEQRTNLSTYSTAIGNPAVWTWQTGAVDSTATFYAGQAPDGSLNATLLTANTSTLSYPNFFQGVSINTSTIYTLSYFAKPVAGKTTVSTAIYDTVTNLNSLYVIYNFATNSFTTSTVGNTTTIAISPSASLYPNGWYRINCGFNFNSGPSNRFIQFKLNLEASGSPQIGQGILFWGSQIEAGAFATSFIPTTVATVTRAGDYAYVIGNAISNIVNPNAGTIYGEFDTITNGISSSGGNDFPFLYDFDNLIAPQSDGFRFLLSKGYGPGYFSDTLTNGVDTNKTYPVTLGDLKIHKVATSYQNNDFDFVIDSGQAAGSATASVFPLAIERLSIGSQSYTGGYGNFFSGHIRRLSYYSKRLPTSQLITLTSSTVYTGPNYANVTPPSYNAKVSDFTVQQGVYVNQALEVPDVDKLYATNLLRPTQQASLNINFLKGTLDPRINFTRASGATFVGPDGYIKYAALNQPRFNYSSTSTGTCLGLLIEEQRTNYYSTSSDYYGSLSYVFWDGSLGFRQTGIGTTTGTVYAYSLYVKINAYTGNMSILFDLGDGATTINNTLSTLTTGTWIRLAGTGTQTNPGSFADIRLQNFPAGYSLGGFYGGAPGATCPMTRNYGISPDGQRTSTRLLVVSTTTGAIFGDIEIWGVQVEPGQWSTSYIPTGKNSATRSNDLAVISGQNFTSWYNQNRGTLLTETYISPGYAQFSPTASFYDASFNNVIGQYQYPGILGATLRYLSNIQLGDPDAFLPTSIGLLCRLATTINPGNYYSVANGVGSASVTANQNIIVDRLYIGSSNGGYLDTTIRRLVYYPAVLSTATLKVITSSTYI